MKSILSIILTFMLLPYISLAAERSSERDTSEDTSKEKPQSQPKQPKEESEEPLDFSGTGRPGQQTAGESRGSCVDAVREPIGALLPVSHAGKTVASHPSFWLYFPESATGFSHIEFVIQNEAREDIWRSRFAPNFAAGYQKFSLPTSEPPLKTGQWYRWYAKIYCEDGRASAQYVQGWVERSPLTSQLHVELQDNAKGAHRVYGQHGIWYDAIDRLLSAYKNNPQSLSLASDWRNLVEAKGVELHCLPNVRGSYEAVK